MIAIPTDIELVDAAAATYVPGAVPFIENAGFADRVFKTTRDDGLITFAIEGTYCLAGWIGDFLALGVRDQETKNHPTLGFIHADFYVSALRLYPLIAAAAKTGPVAIAGHSRGAALALMIGGLLIDDGMPPVKIGAFAPPRVGGASFVEIVTSIPFCAYCFGNDPVPQVPFTLLPDFPYQQVPLTLIGQPKVDAIDCHRIANYVEGVKAKAGA